MASKRPLVFYEGIEELRVGDSLDGAGGAEVIDRTDPVLVSVGGLSAGTVLEGKTTEEVLEMMLYPYQPPAFTSFSFGQASPLEVGDSISAGSKTFSWASSNSANVASDSGSITDLQTSEVLASGLPATGSRSLSVAGVTKIAPGSYTFRVRGVNTQGSSYQRDTTTVWQWRKFYGESVDPTLPEAGIPLLRGGVLATGFAGTYSFLGGGYKYLAYPASFGTATTFKDQGTNLDVPFEPYILRDVANQFGVITSYKVHRTTNVLGGAITIIVG